MLVVIVITVFCFCLAELFPCSLEGFAVQCSVDEYETRGNRSLPFRYVALVMMFFLTYSLLIHGVQCILLIEATRSSVIGHYLSDKILIPISNFQCYPFAPLRNCIINEVFFCIFCPTRNYLGMSKDGVIFFDLKVRLISLESGIFFSQFLFLTIK